MAYQVRVLHPLVLAVLGMCLITYSSYYASSGLFQSRTPDPARMLMASQMSSSSESSSSSSTQNVTSHAAMRIANTTIHASPIGAPISSVSEVSPNHTTTHRLASDVIQKILPKLRVESGANTVSGNTTNSTSDRTEQGILTRYVYESGFEISNEGLCLELGKNMKLLIAITSAPNHKEARMAIRQTWGHYRQRSDIKIAFLLGSTKDQRLSQELKEENGLYGDLICARFLDSYNNLTLKTISMLEWVDSYCSHVGFILKTDDDMFINIPKLLTFVEKHSKDRKTVFGRLAKKWKPIRNKKSKYYVSVNQYQPPLFPDFTTGPAYLMTGDVIHDLYDAALGKTYLKLEDVFITGIVAQDMKIKRTHVHEFLNKRVTLNACNIQKGISIHMVKPPEQYDLWKKLLDGKSKCK
ncbi:hypothetical protein C0J52_01427 [Blattella germanica]|nr:hypothetical protein C0J52_01427 [Blattella germanica]